MRRELPASGIIVTYNPVVENGVRFTGTKRSGNKEGVSNPFASMIPHPTRYHPSWDCSWFSWEPGLIHTSYLSDTLLGEWTSISRKTMVFDFVTTSNIFPFCMRFPPYVVEMSPASSPPPIASSSPPIVSSSTDRIWWWFDTRCCGFRIRFAKEKCFTDDISSIVATSSDIDPRRRIWFKTRRYWRALFFCCLNLIYSFPFILYINTL